MRRGLRQLNEIFDRDIRACNPVLFGISFRLP
jgi:hypothetical protein